MNESKYICGVNISIMLQIHLMVKALAQLPRKKNTQKYLFNKPCVRLCFIFVLCLSDKKDLIVTTEDMQSQQTQSASQKPIYEIYYSNNCLKQPLKNRQNKCHKDQRWLKEGGKIAERSLGAFCWSILNTFTCI